MYQPTCVHGSTNIWYLHCVCCIFNVEFVEVETIVFYSEIFIILILLMNIMFSCIFKGMGIAIHVFCYHWGSIFIVTVYISLQWVKNKLCNCIIRHYVWPFGCWRWSDNFTLRVGGDNCKHLVVGVDGRWSWKKIGHMVWFYWLLMHCAYIISSVISISASIHFGDD
jgi:hypothetical protein